jgi:ubiquinone/menaquinone biosynthesis C-methylase UbiE
VSLLVSVVTLDRGRSIGFGALVLILMYLFMSSPCWSRRSAGSYLARSTTAGGYPDKVSRRWKCLFSASRSCAEVLAGRALNRDLVGRSTPRTRHGTRCRRSAHSDVAALYDRIALSYQRWWAPVITRYVAAPRPRRTRRGGPSGAVIVDGVRNGYLARAAVARWPEVRAIAVDPSTGMLDVGRAEAERTLEPPARRRIKWTIGAAERLPVDDGAADAVVSSFTLQYLRNRGAALREAYRILRPGGAIAVVTWLASDWPFAPNQLLGALLDELHIGRPPSSETVVPVAAVGGRPHRAPGSYSTPLGHR